MFGIDMKKGFPLLDKPVIEKLWEASVEKQSKRESAAGHSGRGG